MREGGRESGGRKEGWVASTYREDSGPVSEGGREGEREGKREGVCDIVLRCTCCQQHIQSL